MRRSDGILLTLAPARAAGPLSALYPLRFPTLVSSSASRSHGACAGSSDDDAFYDRTRRDGSGGAAAAPGGGGKRAKRQPAAVAIDAATLSAQREALNAERAQLHEAIERESLLAAEVRDPSNSS